MSSFLQINWYHFECFTVAIMTWLTVTEFLFHRWSRMSFFLYESSPIFLLKITRMGTAYHSGRPGFPHLGFAQSLVFCVVFWRPLYLSVPHSFGHCLSFDLLQTSVSVSSNISYICLNECTSYNRYQYIHLKWRLSSFQNNYRQIKMTPHA